MWRKGKLRKEGRVWCVEGGGWADADESWVLRGLGRRRWPMSGE